MIEELSKYIDLAAEKIGGQVLFATDDFFAEKENLIKEGRGVFIPDKYTDRGKWMDGWESRRKRVAGHDFAILKLGVPGKIKGFDIDTNHFLGNHPPHARVEALHLSDDSEMDWTNSDELNWTEVLPKVNLNPGSQHLFEIQNNAVYTHIRLHIYPDGGVARFRVFGEVVKDWTTISSNEWIDLASILNGGKALQCNDMFFSSMNNLIYPSKGKNMGDGWETKRNRTPGNVDWVILKLGHQGIVKQIIVDTHHFKGNYPDACAILACNCSDDAKVLINEVEWKSLLEKTNLSAHQEHQFIEEDLQCHDAITHIKLNIYPDGGVSRLRIFGNIV
jgi:allantoicase